MIELDFHKQYRETHQRGFFTLFSSKEGPAVRSYLFLNEVQTHLENHSSKRLAHVLLDQPELIYGLKEDADIKTDFFLPIKKSAARGMLIILDIPAAVESLGRSNVLKYLEENLSRFLYNKDLLYEYEQTERWKGHYETDGMLFYQEVQAKTGLTRAEITTLLFAPGQAKIQCFAPPEYEDEMGIDGSLIAMLERAPQKIQEGGTKESQSDGDEDARLAMMMNSQAHGFMRAFERQKKSSDSDSFKSIPEIAYEALPYLYFTPKGVEYNSPEAKMARSWSHRFEVLFYQLLMISSIATISCITTARFAPSTWESIIKTGNEIQEKCRQLLGK